MLTYLMFGLGFYLGLALKDPLPMLKVGRWAIIRGLLFALALWPIGLVLMVWFALDKIVKEKKKLP